MNQATLTMNVFTDLSEQQQEAAVTYHLNNILSDILDGSLVVADILEENRIADRDDIQERIDRAIKRANDMQTPWFAHEYIMDECRDELLDLARDIAQSTVYIYSPRPVIELQRLRVEEVENA